MKTLTMRTPTLDGSLHPAADGISLASVLGALRRRKRLVIWTVVVVNALAIATALLLTPLYSATARLMIDPSSARVVEGGTVIRPGPEVVSDTSLVPTQIDLLRSPALAVQVITALGLEDHPELRPGISPLTRLRLWLSEQPFYEWASDWLPAPPAPAQLEHGAQAAVSEFLDRLSIGQQRDSRVIAISYSSSDPVLAARVANAMVQAYMESRANSRLEAAERAYRWVSDRVAELRRQLQEAEAQATDFMAANGLPRVGPGGPDAEQPPSLRRELAAARADRAAKEARLAQLRDLQARRASYDSLPEVGGSAIIQALQQQAGALRVQEAQSASIYGANHPSLQQARAQRESIERRIAAEAQNIVRGIADETTRARTRERELEQALSDSMRQYVVSETAAIRLNELTRVVDTKSTLYRAMLSRLEEIGERRGLTEPGAEVVAAAAVPQNRAFPRLSILLGGGFAGSLILALGLAALAEHSDRGLRAAQDVERSLGLPNLALVPWVKQGRKRGRPHSYVFNRPQSSYAEAIRGLVRGIDQADTSQSAKVLLVTSTWPGEGKTTLAISLAAMAARCGRRTVIVDLDLRHPSVARELGLKVQAGLAEYIQDRHPLDEVVQTSREDARLHVIPVRQPVANPSDVLDSPRLKELIALLRRYYDTVVLDVPPALGISDAQAVGLLSDAAVLVARWGSTSEDAAVNGVGALQRAGVSVIGCVLTQVDLRRHALYGYHDAGEFYRTYRRYFRQ
jgi:capsular exopolysaccharide synthesis family protein